MIFSSSCFLILTHFVALDHSCKYVNHKAQHKYFYASRNSNLK